MYSERADQHDKNRHTDCNPKTTQDNYEDQICKQQLSRYKRGKSHSSATPQRRSPRRRRDKLNTITRILSNTACYTSATCCAFIIGAYHPHPFRPVEGSEGGCSGTASISMRRLGRLLRYLQPESIIDRGGTGRELDAIKNKNWAFMLIHHRYTTERSTKLTLDQSRTSALLDELEISKILSDPPPLLFLSAVITFSLAISSLWRSQARNRHRNLCVGVVMMSGVLCVVYNGNLMNEGKGILAWYTIFALACSSMIHWMLELLVKNDVQFDEKTLVYEGRDNKEARLGIVHEKERATVEAQI